MIGRDSSGAMKREMRVFAGRSPGVGRTMIRRRGETAREAPGWHLNRVLLLRNLTRGQQAQAHIMILNEAETRRELASFLSSRVRI